MGFADKEKDNKPVVLTIDDDAQQLRANTMICERLGFRVVSVHAGGVKENERFTAAVDDLDELRAVAKEHGPINMILTDYDMPNFNGLDVMNALRELEGAHQINAIVASGNDDEAVSKAIEESKNTVRLHKPFKKADLGDAINALFGKGRGASPAD